MNNMIHAIQQNDLELVQKLLTEDPESAYDLTDVGVSMLMMSIYFQRTEITALLVKAITKLTYFEACALGDAETVAKRLDEDPQQIYENSADGFSGIGLASFFGKDLVVALLIELGADIQKASANPLRVAPLHSAAAGGHLGIVEVLLNAGAEVNAKQEGGFTPLHSAAQNADLEMVKLLIEYGADPLALTDLDQLPIDLLDREANPEIADLLEI